MPRAPRQHATRRSSGEVPEHPEQTDSPQVPSTLEQLLMTQTQLLQQMAASMAQHQQLLVTLLAQQQQQQQAPQQPPQANLGEFMKTKPPEFEGSGDPLEADDWLKDIEKKLRAASVSTADKVKFAAHQLKGVAADWWDNYCAAKEDPEEIAWTEFAEAFRTAHIPAGIMELKRKEFLDLKQDKMTVTEYLSRFTQLARYGKRDVASEEDKISRFHDGLTGGLQNMLVAHTFSTFQDLVNKAILQENSRRQLKEERKNKNKSAPRSYPTSSSSRVKIPQPQGYLRQSQRPIKPSHPEPRPEYQTPRAQVGGFRANTAERPCFNCRQLGHFTNQCPERKNVQPAPIQPGTGSAT